MWHIGQQLFFDKEYQPYDHITSFSDVELIVCRKPGALRPVTNATIKSLTCFCLFGLWPKIGAHRSKERAPR